MDNLIKQWKKEEQVLFKGWDFSYLKNRMIEKSPPWDYKKKAKELVSKSSSLLDMGTGGGEVLFSFKPLPHKTIAIEDYLPNVKEAKDRLNPIGVEVLKVDEAGKLPFNNKEFDLVLNRHSAFDADEVYRILQKNGIFITQQVDGANLDDLINEFNSKNQWPFWKLEYAKNKFFKAGFKIEESIKWSGEVEFKDVGAIVYFLRSVPWVVKDFCISNNLSNLEKIQNKLNSGKKLVYTMRRFFIKVIKE